MQIIVNEKSVINFQDVGRSKHSGRGAKVLSAKVTARPDSRRSASVPNVAQTLAPPMTSVVVERHQPINKVMFACFYAQVFNWSYVIVLNLVAS